jgi:aspartyl-tRNA(Asn)/glutamyl-tRNA(Gln) amidotransferase subunit C
LSKIITKEDVAHIAELSRLSFSEKELAQFTGELNNILDYIHKLDELDTTDIPPTSHVLDISNVFREDTIHEHLNREDALKNAPEHEHNHFKVPRAVEG